MGFFVASPGCLTWTTFFQVNVGASFGLSRGATPRFLAGEEILVGLNVGFKKIMEITNKLRVNHKYEI